MIISSFSASEALDRKPFSINVARSFEVAWGNRGVPIPAKGPSFGNHLETQAERQSRGESRQPM
jgi:hypothetical protein